MFTVISSKNSSPFQIVSYFKLINRTGSQNNFLVCTFDVSAQHYATAAAPEKIEVFVNDKRLLVDPGVTVLQVR